jgi:formamidopyrimidine-DNA glycosylase
MPELPEVETIRSELQDTILNKTITDVNVLLSRSFENPHSLPPCGLVENITRHGKYLIIDIKKQCTLIIHLRMTGKLIVTNNTDILIHPHNRVIFHLNTNEYLIFSDVRTFGKVEVVPYKIQFSQIKNIGIDAMSAKFTKDYFIKVCQNKKMPIKSLLLDQTLIAGIGNIYAIEILFATKISPLRPANTLNNVELTNIYHEISKILTLAIKHNGTSISDFRRVDDKTGEFQDFLQIYGKDKCPICHNELTRIKQAGRGTRYCSTCQR